MIWWNKTSVECLLTSHLSGFISWENFIVQFIKIQVLHKYWEWLLLKRLLKLIRLSVIIKLIKLRLIKKIIFNSELTANQTTVCWGFFLQNFRRAHLTSCNWKLYYILLHPNLKMNFHTRWNTGLKSTCRTVIYLFCSIKMTQLLSTNLKSELQFLSVS